MDNYLGPKAEVIKAQRDALIDALGNALERIEFLGKQIDEFTALGRGPATKMITENSLALLDLILRPEYESK